jgi:hypothetical protein
MQRHITHYIIGHLVFVLVSTEWIIMCTEIHNPASCEIRAVIRFLHAKTNSTEENINNLFLTRN